MANLFTQKGDSHFRESLVQLSSEGNCGASVRQVQFSVDVFQVRSQRVQ